MADEDLGSRRYGKDAIGQWCRVSANLVFGNTWGRQMFHDYKSVWLCGKVVGYEHARD